MRFANRWTGCSCVFVAAFTVLLGTVVWWFLTHALPSVLRPPSDTWKAKLQLASRKHFACNKQQFCVSVINSKEPNQAGQLSNRAVRGLVNLFLRLPDLLDTHPIVEQSVLEYENQKFELYCLPAKAHERDVEVANICFGVSRDGYVRLVIFKFLSPSTGIAGADFVLMKFETLKLESGCVVPDTAIVEWYKSSGSSASKLCYSTRVRLEYD